MRFLKMMSFAEAHEVLKACRTTLREGDDVIDLEADVHIACRDLTDSVALLETGAEFCGYCPPHMSDCSYIGAIHHEQL